MTSLNGNVVLDVAVTADAAAAAVTSSNLFVTKLDMIKSLMRKKSTEYNEVEVEGVEGDDDEDEDDEEGEDDEKAVVLFMVVVVVEDDDIDDEASLDVLG